MDLVKLVFLMFIFAFSVMMVMWNPHAAESQDNAKTFVIITPSGGRFVIKNPTILNYDVKGLTVDNKEAYLIGQCYMIEIKDEKSEMDGAKSCPEAFIPFAR